MEHHFNIDLASKYGVNEAIFCHNLYFWIIKNRANKKHFYDGHYWTYNTMAAFTELFPYWTYKQLRTVITNCEKKGLIVKGNYNKSSYDQTLWYTITDLVFGVYEPSSVASCPNGQMELPETESSNCPNGQMEMTERANGIDQKGRPIPDNKPDNKHISKDHDFVNKENIVNKLVFEFMNKGLPKKICFTVVSEVPEEGVKNFGGYLRVALQNALSFYNIKHNKTDTASKMGMEYNWLEERE
jgi:hypothetical protein